MDCGNNYEKILPYFVNDIGIDPRRNQRFIGYGKPYRSYHSPWI